MLAKVLQVVKLSDGNYKAVVEGYDRVKIEKYSVSKSMIKAKISLIDNFIDTDSQQIQQLNRVMLSAFADYTRRQTQKEFPDTINRLNQMEDVLSVWILLSLIFPLKLRLSKKCWRRKL